MDTWCWTAVQMHRGATQRVWVQILNKWCPCISHLQVQVSSHIIKPLRERMVIVVFDQILTAFGFVGFIATVMVIAMAVCGGEIRVGISRKREIQMFAKGVRSSSKIRTHKLRKCIR